MLQWTKANFPGVRFRVHSTRKHGVRYDTNLYLIKDLLGHSDLKLTERYAHICREPA